VAVAAQPGGVVVSYRAPGGVYKGLRPTAVGLPQIGEQGTVGVGDFAAVLRRYHDSGAYERDLSTVDGAAQRYLDRRLTEKHKGKPALVLDIDETALSNYAGLVKSGFTAAGLAQSVVSGTMVPIKPTLALYRNALRHHVAVFFITGRPSLLDALTKTDLRGAGYNSGWKALYEKPLTEGVEAFKSATRAAIQHRGYDIIANVGDQESDLDGGHADAAFKLPDPFYFIADR
jgi:predicted secreted acid phosphatase